MESLRGQSYKLYAWHGDGIEIKISGNSGYSNKMLPEILRLFLKRRKSSVKIIRQGFQVWLVTADTFGHTSRVESWHERQKHCCPGWAAPDAQVQMLLVL